MDLSCIMRAVQASSHTSLLYIDQICLYFSFVKPEMHQVSICHYTDRASNNAHSPSVVDNIQSWDKKNCCIRDGPFQVALSHGICPPT